MVLEHGMVAPSMHRRRFVLTQTNVAATDILFRAAVRATVLMELDVLTTGPDDYAAARAVTARVVNSSGNVVEQATIASVDNQRVHWSPRSDGAPAADNAMRRTTGWLIYPGDRVEVVVAAAAQNETLTVQWRARATGLITYSSPTSGVDMTESEA